MCSLIFIFFVLARPSAEVKLDMFSTGPTTPESNVKKSPNPQTDINELLFDPVPLMQHPTQVQPTTTGIRPTGIGNLMLSQQQQQLQPPQFHQLPVMQVQTDNLMMDPGMSVPGPMLPGLLVGVGPTMSGSPAAVNTMLPGNPAAVNIMLPGNPAAANIMLLGQQASVGSTMPGYPTASGGPAFTGIQTAGGSMLPGSPGVAGSAGVMIPTKSSGKEIPPTTALKAADCATLGVSVCMSTTFYLILRLH